MSKDLLRQETPESAIGTVQNYLAVAHRYDYEPPPEVVIRLLREQGYAIRRLPRKEGNGRQQGR